MAGKFSEASVPFGAPYDTGDVKITLSGGSKDDEFNLCLATSNGPVCENVTNGACVVAADGRAYSVATQPNFEGIRTALAQHLSSCFSDFDLREAIIMRELVVALSLSLLPMFWIALHAVGFCGSLHVVWKICVATGALTCVVFAIGDVWKWYHFVGFGDGGFWACLGDWAILLEILLFGAYVLYWELK
jgi:hypothetical protein